MDDLPTATPLGEKVREVAASPTHPSTNHPISPETLATNTSPLRSTIQEVVQSAIRCLQQPQNSTPRLCSRGSTTAHSHFRMGGEWNTRSLDTPTDSRSGSNPVLTATPSTIGREDHRLKMTIEKQTLMSMAIQALLEKEAIEEIPFARMSFQSYMFPLHKHGKVRAVLDCRDLNQYIAHERFKMESLPTLRYMIATEIG